MVICKCGANLTYNIVTVIRKSFSMVKDLNNGVSHLQWLQKYNVRIKWYKKLGQFFLGTISNKIVSLIEESITFTSQTFLNLSL